jgi:2-polyprenyl-3-methyl-5-hydroxy-6-metoxy-1,4-benzoquinol methylase
MTKAHIDSCPICGESHFTIGLACKDLYSTQENFDIMHCAKCGFAFTQNAPDEESIGSYYEGTAYVSHSDTKKGLTNKLYHSARKYMLGKKANIVTQNIHTTSRWLLDVGCGTGYFLHHMHQKGWSVKGIEKNEEARAFSLHQLGIMTDASEELFKFDEKQFGVITMWHSLEHLHRLNETFAQLNKILTDNGTLVIAVPNIDSCDAIHYKEYWAAYDVPRHLWHFSLSSLEKLAEKHHFVVDKIYPMPLDAFYISILSEKYKKNFFSFVQGILIGIRCWISSRKKDNRSSSLVYILKKADHYDRK